MARMIVADRDYVLSKYKLEKIKDIEDLVAEAQVIIPFTTISSGSVPSHIRPASTPNPPPPREPGEPSPTPGERPHPRSPMLTYPHPPPPARPIDSGCAGAILAPGQRGRNGLPRRCRFWVATHRMVD